MTKQEYDKKYYLKNKEKINIRNRKRSRLYRQQNKEKIKKYNQEHHLQILESQARCRRRNKEKRRLFDQLRWQKDKKNLQIYYKQWRKNNKEKINQYRSNLKKSDIQFRLACNLRTRISNVISRNVKIGSAVKNLGCTLGELKKHLESKFSVGMTWENYGQWHIDHIKPLSSFNLNDKKEFLVACHYTNLQPLWASDNISKKNKFN